MLLLSDVQIQQVSGGCPNDVPEGISKNCWTAVSVCANFYAQGFLTHDAVLTLIDKSCSEQEKEWIANIAHSEEGIC